MKKRIIFFLLFAALVISCGEKEQRPSLGAEVKAVTGQAYIFRKGSTEWKELKSSSPVDFGDSLKTGGNSLVEVAFGSSNTIKIDENSKIFLSQITDSSGSSRIEVFNCNGSVSSNIEKLPKAHDLFQVRTPMSVAKIEGTFFIVTYHAKRKKSSVNVLAGKVWVRNPHAARGFVVVHPGFFTVISWGRPPGKPVKLNYGQWKKHHRILGPGIHKNYGKKFKIKHAVKRKPLKKGVKFKRSKPLPKVKRGYKIKQKRPRKNPGKGKIKVGGGKKKGGKRK